MKKLFFFLLLFSFNLLAQDISAYNVPAEIKPNDSLNIFLSASFIYWKTQEEGLSYAYVTDINDVYLYTVSPQYKYKPGFKIAIGGLFANDNWTVFAEYLRLYTRQVGNIKIGSDNSLVATWMNTSHDFFELLKTASSCWKLHTNIATLDLKRVYYMGAYLTLAPIMGVKFLSIYQALDVRYLGNVIILPPRDNINFIVKNTSSSWGIGPLGGFDMNYIFGGGFRLLANGTICLAYQHFNVTNKGSLENIAVKQINKNVNGYFSPNCSGLIGLGYGTYFANKKAHFDSFIAYEVNYFWNQNQMRRLKDSLENSIDGFAGALSFYGLTLNVRFDF
jgi:hypothetical protein